MLVDGFRVELKLLISVDYIQRKALRWAGVGVVGSEDDLDDRLNIVHLIIISKGRGRRREGIVWEREWVVMRLRRGEERSEDILNGKAVNCVSLFVFLGAVDGRIQWPGNGDEVRGDYYT